MKCRGCVALAGAAAHARTPLAFEGTAERGVVSGTVKRPDGTQVATFAGRPDKNGVLRGSATFAGRTQPWSADGVVLPSATAF